VAKSTFSFQEQDSGLEAKLRSITRGGHAVTALTAEIPATVQEVVAARNSRCSGEGGRTQKGQ
jgi:hypothetical protein